MPRPFPYRTVRPAVPRRRGPARRAAAVVLLLALAVLPVVPAGPGARAAENGEWSVYPVAPGPGGRPYFHLAAAPGATLTDRVTVTNKTAAPLSFRLYAADAYNTRRDGGFAVRAVTERQRGIGAWARPARERITVPPRGAVTVPYTLTVPADAEPGDHAGALVALDERIATTGGPVAVGVRQAVGARVHLRVNGPAVPALSVEDIVVRRDGPLLPGTGASSALISYTLHNRGNTTLGPAVALRAEGLFGRTLLRRAAAGVPSELLPRQRIRLTERWQGAPRAEWGEIRITATAGDVRDSAGARYAAVPWLPGALLALLAAGGVLLVRARRRVRRAGTAPRPVRAP
ncbi:WxL protein peptidoglycan domain-containing protein [Streptomyces sp. NPDC003691]